MTGFYAFGAYGNLFYLPLMDRTYILQIGIKTTLVNIMGMANIIANHGLLSTYFTYSRHFYSVYKVRV
jgi:hypothetical protein